MPLEAKVSGVEVWTYIVCLSNNLAGGQFNSTITPNRANI